MALAKMSKKLTDLVKAEPIEFVTFSTHWDASSRDPSEGVEEWTAEGHIRFGDTMEEGRQEARQIGETAVVAVAHGYVVRPAIAGQRYTIAISNVYDTYDAPDDVDGGLYESLYDTDDDVLLPEAVEAMGEDGGLYDRVVPYRHTHIDRIEFATGFASREDLAVMIDNLALRLGCVTSPYDGLLTMNAKAVEGLDMETGHGQLDAGALLEDLGFTLVGDYFVYGSMNGLVEKRRLERLEEQQEYDIRRTPLVG